MARRSSNMTLSMADAEATLLTAYIWDHYQHLMTPFEREVGAALIARAQASASASRSLAATVLARFGKLDRPDINAALQDGAHVFRTQVRIRPLAMSSDSIVLNRCPSCQRLARTPQARLCVWCGAADHK